MALWNNAPHLFAPMDIRLDDLRHPDVIALLQEHLDWMHRTSPPESVHALDLDGLRGDGISFWAAWDGEVLAGPTLITHLQSKLPELRRGRPVEMQYLVAEQAMVLGLRASATRYGADGRTNLRVEASSALLRPFVPTTLISFDADGRFVGMQGRLLPQKQRGVPLDGVIRVTYPTGMRVASMKSSCNKSTVS